MRFLSGGPRVREYLTGVTKMTEQRNSRIALLAVVMLLSGAFLGLLVSDNASAADTISMVLFLTTIPMFQ